MLAFTALSTLAGAVGGVLPYEGEIRYFTWRNNISNVYIMDALRGVAYQPRMLPDFYRPSWSPNHQYIIASMMGGGTYLMRIDGGAPILLYDRDGYPRWSPDNQRLVFVGFTDPNWFIYMANGNGTTISPLFADAADYFEPIFSPDSTQLAYIRNGDLYVVNLLDNNVIRLTETPEEENFPLWSPNGQYIAFLWGQFQNWHLSTVSADGQHRVDFNGSNVGNFLWSSDSTQLSFKALENTAAHVFIANMNDGTTRMLPLEYPLNVGISAQWQEDDAILHVSWLELDNQGLADTFYQDEVDAATGELLQREQLPDNYAGISPNERWLLAYHYNREICVLERATQETQRCFMVIGSAGGFVWLP